MGVKVAKFGGSSVADATQLHKVQAIVREDRERRIVVVSAPGKRTREDTKITDLLYRCHDCVGDRDTFDRAFQAIAERYRTIVRDLGLAVDIERDLAAVYDGMTRSTTSDFAASRGEYLNAKIVASLLDSEFVDAADVIRFDIGGRLQTEETVAAVADRLRTGTPVVVPGFYGAKPDGSIQTFSRGGSDITGALLARGVRADVYENWTDVSGVLMADPRIVSQPRTIPKLSYRELRELAYMGANVLHEEAVFPVIDLDIPVNVRNTNVPNEPGTLIVRQEEGSSSTIIGIAGRKGYTVIALEKNLMNREVGIGRRLLTALERQQVSFEHMPTGIDTMSVVVESSYLKGKLEPVLDEIRRECRPDRIDVFENMALIATVGRGMLHTPGVAGQLFGALATANVKVRMIDQGSSGINIIVGVEAGDFETAIRAIYKAFVS
ncbi:MAG TPA: aspartate kinase [Terriglobia bacterium]|nr:aspartate kinase [Terriglobia bacterium]